MDNNFKIFGELKVNGYTDINGYRYFIESNMNNKYYTVRVMDLNTRESTTLCTRGTIFTAYDKAMKHIKSKEV